MKSYTRRAFTLIELLVVIAIIAILAAILFPVFAQAKEAAKKTACLAGQKQIGIGMYMYLQDSDDTLPMANYGTDENGNVYQGPPWSQFSFLAGGVQEPNWADLFQPYAKSFDIFKCPVDNSGPVKNNGVPVPGHLLCYALNYYFYRTPNGFRGSLNGGNMSEITTPASKLFVVESASSASREIVNPARYAGLERHTKGANYVYADTHAHFHVMPQWWKNYTSQQWGDMNFAPTLPCAQWFPWIDGSEQW